MIWKLSEMILHNTESILHSLLLTFSSLNPTRSLIAVDPAAFIFTLSGTETLDSKRPIDAIRTL